VVAELWAVGPSRPSPRCWLRSKVASAARSPATIGCLSDEADDLVLAYRPYYRASLLQKGPRLAAPAGLYEPPTPEGSAEHTEPAPHGPQRVGPRGRIPLDRQKLDPPSRHEQQKSANTVPSGIPRAIQGKLAGLDVNNPAITGKGTRPRFLRHVPPTAGTRHCPSVRCGSVAAYSRN